MSDNRNNKTSKDTLILILALVIIAAVGLVAYFIQVPREKQESAAETETIDPDQSGKMVTQEYGNSDLFYRNDEEKKVIVDFGKGKYDISQGVVKWSFGEPVVNASYAAETWGLHFMPGAPEGYKAPARYEVYPEGEDFDISERLSFTLYDDDGNIAMYTITSGVVCDKDGLTYKHPYCVEVTEEGEPLISVTSLPYLGNGSFTLDTQTQYDYGTDSIKLSISERETEIVEELE